jgi:hypothetical protein
MNFKQAKVDLFNMRDYVEFLDRLGFDIVQIKPNKEFSKIVDQYDRA